MDRTEYLQLCQKVSMLKSGICGIKQNVPPELLVKHNEIVYYPHAYELSFDNGKTQHKAILHSLNVNSVVYCDLKKVERVNCNGQIH